MPRKKVETPLLPTPSPNKSQTMDLGAPIKNPATGHSSFIDEKALEWAGVNADILHYLQSIDELQKFADWSQNAESLADRVDPFIENAKIALESLAKLAEGQADWTEIRKQYGSSVANAISKIRNLNANFGVEMEKLDAKDRASMTKLEQKRNNALAEIATDLVQSMGAEAIRHNSQIENIGGRAIAQEERKNITASFQEKRKALMDRARYGSRALNPSKDPVANIPVSIAPNQPHHQSSPNATGTPGGWGQRFQGFWNQVVG